MRAPLLAGQPAPVLAFSGAGRRRAKRSATIPPYLREHVRLMQQLYEECDSAFELATGMAESLAKSNPPGTRAAWAHYIRTGDRRLVDDLRLSDG